MHSTWKTWTKRWGSQVVQIRKSTRNLPRRGRRSGKGEKIRIQQTLHISAKILKTIAIIATLMATLRKNVGNYIQR
jgi:hypothetical protein